MKPAFLMCFAATMFFIAPVPVRLAAQDRQREPTNQSHYTVQSLGSLGGTSCCLVIEINNRDWVDGTSNLAGDNNFHPFLWRDGHMQDLGTLGGPNASAGGLNERGDVTVGGSDTGIPDPLGEDFCGYGTHQICLSFVWHHGNRTLIPTLGGTNNDVNTINNRGQVLAYAETASSDPTCISPQILGFEAFIWDPKSGEIHTLPPLAGDSVSVGFGLNEKGEVAGTSGICGSITGASALHIVLWKNGVPTNLGNLGGATGNVAFDVNNRGQVVGNSDLPGDVTFHGFLWQNDILTDLGTLPGDFASAASAINDRGQVAAQSCDVNFNCRATIWQGGVMTDLNTLIPPGTPLFLLAADSINSAGQIVGAALDQTGAVVPFLATPCDEKNAGDEGCRDGDRSAAGIQRRNLPENVREILRQQRGLGHFRPRMIRPQ